MDYESRSIAHFELHNSCDILLLDVKTEWSWLILTCVISYKNSKLIRYSSWYFLNLKKIAILYALINITGILGSDSKIWQDNRRFALAHLRDLGLGKSKLEDTIMIEVSALIEQFDKKLGQPCELSWMINVAILNIIWGLIACKFNFMSSNL